jgi:2-dehydropantoate 2-reductase
MEPSLGWGTAVRRMAASRSIVVYGAGAVGCYLGGKVATANPSTSITLIGRPAIVEAIEARGLMIVEGATTTITRPNAASTVIGLPAVDLVLLSVRAYDVEASLTDLWTLLGDDGSLVALQNGVGSEEILARELGRERVLAGTLTVSVGMEEPGIVTRHSSGGGIALAPMNRRPIPRWIVDDFAATDLPTIVVADYEELRWSKLLLNMLGAATSAILDINVGTVASDPRLFRLEQLAFREAGRVMDALGLGSVSLPGYPVPLARLATRLPRPLAQALIGPRLARSRGGHSPTMRAGLAHGRSETAYLNGVVAAEAERLGVAAPVNQALTELTQQLVAHPERRAEFEGRPETLVAELKRCGISI